eukprot:2162852-Rhodomonas_salina.1
MPGDSRCQNMTHSIIAASTPDGTALLHVTPNGSTTPLAGGRRESGMPAAPAGETVHIATVTFGTVAGLFWLRDAHVLVVDVVLRETRVRALELAAMTSYTLDTLGGE